MKNKYNGIIIKNGTELYHMGIILKKCIKRDCLCNQLGECYCYPDEIEIGDDYHCATFVGRTRNGIKTVLQHSFGINKRLFIKQPLRSKQTVNRPARVINVYDGYSLIVIDERERTTINNMDLLALEYARRKEK